MWRWLPDADPTTPEIYTDMSGMYPTSDGGYAVIPVVNNGATLLSGTDTQSGAPYGGFVRYLDGTVKLIWNVSATGNKIYENSTDVTGTAATMRAVAMYGNVCIITQGRSLNVKAKTGTGGTFADLAGSPPDSDFIVSNNLAVMLLSYNDGTDTPDGWWASDIGDHTTWTPASTNQAANGRLTQTPGPITGGIAFKDAIYAFKESSVFVGRYVGRPLIWQWQLLRSDIGCPNQEAILTDGNYLYFMGRAGAYRFDGYNFQRIDDGVWGGTTATPQGAGIGGLVQLAAANSGKLFGLFDETSGCCVWWARRPGVGTDGGWAYNTKTGLWGNVANLVGVSGVNPSGVPYPMTRDLVIGSGISAVSQYADAAWVLLGSDNKLYTMNAPNSAASSKISAYVTTGKIGALDHMTEVSRITPVLIPNRLQSSDPDDAVDATFTLTPYTADSALEAMTAGSDVSSSTDLKRFDYMKSARFHAFKIANATHDWKIMGVDVKARKPAGRD